ncbi:MAG: substrate-binding domain-containing protein [Candidatus Puniceispirillum sp.]
MVGYITLLTGFFAMAGHAAAPVIIVQSATSIQNSGLYDHLLPLFEAENDIDVRIVAVGTGQALRNAKKCDAELVIVHSKIDEEKFVTDGFGSQRHDLMYNDFILVGPKNDPAQIGTAKTTIEAFQKIAAAKARFASRSDDSGTHKAERRFWQAARTTPTDASGKWYLETGLGMGATLNFAVQADAYALTDRATWLTFKNKTTHMPLFQGDPALFNQYGVVLVSQIHCPTIKAAESRIFANWLLSPKGQTAIATFQHENRPLFFPNATP